MSAFAYRLPLASLSVLVVAVASACATGAAEPPEPAPLAVRTVAVERGTLRETVSYVGTLAARHEARVVARLPGTVTELGPEEGEPIARGDRLAVVSVPEQSARVSQVGNDVARLDAEAKHACETFETDRTLHERGVLARMQLDASRTRCESARAALRAARSRRREARDVSDKQIERAPLDGRVLRWIAEPGEHVMPGQPLLLVGSDAMEVRVDVVEPDLREGIEVGSPAHVRLADGHPLDAAVTRIAAASRGPARVVEVAIALPPEVTGGLPHGSSVDVAFVARERNDAWIVPDEAVQEHDDGAVIYSVEGETLRAIDVRPQLSARGRVAIVGELGPEMRVALGEPDELREGLDVYAVPLTPGEAP